MENLFKKHLMEYSSMKPSERFWIGGVYITPQSTLLECVGYGDGYIFRAIGGTVEFNVQQEEFETFILSEKETRILYKKEFEND